MLFPTENDLNSRSVETNGSPYSRASSRDRPFIPVNEDRCKTRGVVHLQVQLPLANVGADTIISSVTTNPLLMVG